MVETTEFKEGDVVCSRKQPEALLIVRRYIKRIYYCKTVDHPEREDLVFFARELMRPDINPSSLASVG